MCVARGETNRMTPDSLYKLFSQKPPQGGMSCADLVEHTITKRNKINTLLLIQMTSLFCLDQNGQIVTKSMFPHYRFPFPATLPALRFPFSSGCSLHKTLW